jgi:hypothetical protein
MKIIFLKSLLDKKLYVVINHIFSQQLELNLLEKTETFFRQMMNHENEDERRKKNVKKIEFFPNKL